MIPFKACTSLRLIPAHAGKTSGSRSAHSQPWAHPRSRGENLPALSMLLRARGSSPLTRGKRVRVKKESPHVRLIPAHAGKTRARRCLSVTSTAHPRSRGENTTARWQGAHNVGSSPLTRGKRRLPGTAGFDERLIPAHAGKTTRASTRPSMIAAHPRSRGENVEGCFDAVLEAGSSPLTRGKRLREQAQQARRRLIPAHAGKTALSHGITRALPAHPRSRGEN